MSEFVLVSSSNLIKFKSVCFQQQWQILVVSLIAVVITRWPGVCDGVTICLQVQRERFRLKSVFCLLHKRILCNMRQDPEKYMSQSNRSFSHRRCACLPLVFWCDSQWVIILTQIDMIMKMTVQLQPSYIPLYITNTQKVNWFKVETLINLRFKP